MKINMN